MLLLASLDAARAQLSENPDTIFDGAMGLAAEARNQIKGILGISALQGAPGSTFPGFPAVDPLRLTVRVSGLGISGFEAADILEKRHRIGHELHGTHTVTYAISLGTRRVDVQRLVSGFKHLSASVFQEERLLTRPDHVDDDGGVLQGVEGPSADIHTRLSPREAFFAKKREVEFSRSAGEVSGELICSVPPGIPVLAPGEIITNRAIKYLLGLRQRGAVIVGSADYQLSTIIVCDL